jgi:hypothetical protein
MYANMRSDRFARLFNYEQAMRHYETRKEYIKGDNKGLKPFAERARNWLTIRQEGEDVVVKLHRTDIITYKPTGEVIIEQGGWNTSTTHETIGAILGMSLFIKDKIGWITCANGTYPLRSEGANVLRLENGWVYENPVYPKVHKVNRKKRNIVTAKYKAFVDYAFNMAKLLGEDCHHDEEVYKAENGHMYTEQAICDAMLDEARQYNAWLAVLRAADKLVRGKRYGYGSNEARVLTEAELKAAFTTIFNIAHAREIFDEFEMQNGRVVVNKYWKYMRWAK